MYIRTVTGEKAFTRTEREKGAKTGMRFVFLMIE